MPHTVLHLGLILVCIYFVTQPILTSKFYGAADAEWYLHNLHDFLIQLRSGTFPVYAGQTPFVFNSFASPFPPYYYYLAGAIDFATAHRLSIITLQHLTVVVSFGMGGLGMYLALRLLSRGVGWVAAVIACLYIMCPGVSSVIYLMDMYPSIMTLPWIAGLFAAQVYALRVPAKLPGHILTGLFLALLWLCHPPIALWATVLTGVTQIYCWITSGRPLRSVLGTLLTYPLFALLAAWYFVCTFELGLNARGSSQTGMHQLVSVLNPAFASEVSRQLRAVFPAILLPLSPTDSTNALDALQLGYSLWFVLIASSVVVIRLPRATKEIRMLLLCAIAVLFVLFPVPFVSQWLIYHLPAIFEINNLWFMERLYIPLAAAVCIAGGLALEGLWAGSTLRRRSWIAVLLASALLAWSCFQFRMATTTWVNKVTHSDEESAEMTMSENIKAMPYSNQYGGRPYLTRVYDPLFEARFIMDRGEITAPNREYLLRRCAAGAIQYPNTAIGTTQAAARLFSARIQPNTRYALAYRLINRGYSGVLRFFGGTVRRDYYDSADSDGVQIEPIWTSGNDPVQISVEYLGSCAKKECSLEFQPLCFTPYNPADFPVKVSATPVYSAEMETTNSLILETHRVYLQGYRAFVNGAATAVLKSPAGNAAIKVGPGRNRVTLRYVGTPWMRASWWGSLLAWAAVAAYFGFGAIRRRWSTKRFGSLP
jgi:hypothetical protein